MIKLSTDGQFVTRSGVVISMVSNEYNFFVSSDGLTYKEDGMWIYSDGSDSLDVVSAYNPTPQEVSITHSDIQLLRNTLASRLNNLEFLIWENEDWSKRLYRITTPESADGIAAFHELNKCKDSIRYCKKERKHVAELLRKLKKQQAEILRNNVKIGNNHLHYSCQC